MHDYLLSTEVVRFAFIFGVAVSMLLYERRHLTTGSIVVPGYIAAFIVYPLIIVATFLNAFASYLIVNKLLRRWFLLYGRTKFTVLAVTSILIQTAMLKLTPSGPWLWESDIKLFVGVGYVVPALIAHDMGRQGIAKTMRSVLLAASIVAVPIAAALLFNVPGVNDLAPLQGAGNMAIEPAWIPIAVLLSAAASWGVAHNYGFRSGGFVGAAFIGMMLGDPWQVVTAAVLATATYVIVTKFLMNSMILFGRRKFSAMLLVSSALAWSLLWIGTEVFDIAAQRHLELGSLAITPLFVPGLLANDAQRTNPGKVVLGVAMATTFVLTATWWIESLFTGLELAPVWKAVAALSFATIFWRQFVPARSEERATIVTGAPVLAASPTRTPLASALVYGRSGFERWGTLHHDAAAAAERWLVAVLGDQTAPAVAATAAAPGTLPASIAVPSQHERSIERIRRAAIEALSAPVTTLSTSPLARALDERLAVASEAASTDEPPTTGDLPTRPRPRSGEFDAVATGIAAGVRRLPALPRRKPGSTGPIVDVPVIAPVAHAVKVLAHSGLRAHELSELPDPATGADAEPASIGSS